MEDDVATLKKAEVQKIGEFKKRYPSTKMYYILALSLNKTTKLCADSFCIQLCNNLISWALSGLLSTEGEGGRKCRRGLHKTAIFRTIPRRQNRLPEVSYFLDFHQMRSENSLLLQALEALTDQILDIKQQIQTRRV